MRTGLASDKLKGIYRAIANRYDLQHSLITARSDARGRRLLVDRTVREGDIVLDCGAGTGSTGLMAAEHVGPEGRVTLFDLSEDMLRVAREKADAMLLPDIEFRTGDMLDLPFDDGTFDVVLSTYSLCPVYDPAEGIRELYRVTRPGGRLGVAHSAVVTNPILRPIADAVEAVAWRIPALSMGCRAINIRPAIDALGVKVILDRRIGVPLWPFQVFVVEKQDPAPVP